MGFLTIVYCDNCEAATPLLPWARTPNGWAKITFADIGEQMMCSYQCLFDYIKRCLDDPPTMLTPMVPVANPIPSLEGMPLDKVPERFRYYPEEGQ